MRVASRRTSLLRVIGPCLAFVSAALSVLGCSPSDPVAAMNHGVALLEQYNYLPAYTEFAALARSHPEWVAAHVNAGLAALNLQKDDWLKVAEDEFTKALALDKRCPHALLSRGILRHHQNRVDEALADFAAVVEIDPANPQALYEKAVCLFDKGNADEARALFEKAIKLQPSLSSAYWRLRALYAKAGPAERPKMEAAIKEFKRLQDAEMGITVDVKYGEGGKYNLAIRDTVPPGWKGEVKPWAPTPAPAFGPRIPVVPGPLAARKRPDGASSGVAMAAADLSGDGSLEVVACGVQTGSGSSAAVYEQAKGGAWSLGLSLPADADACATGDFDGDYDQDLVLAGAGWLRFFRNDGKGKLDEVKVQVDGTEFAGFPVRLYAADLDSDWDLDVACLRQEAAPGGKVRSRLEALSNNRDGTDGKPSTFRDIAAVAGIEPFDFPAVELIVADLDGDVDADFIVFDGATGAAHAFANDRMWRYHAVDAGPGAPRAPGILSSAAGDIDGDGDEDLVLFCGDMIRLWKNVGGLRFEEDAAFGTRFGATGGSAGVVGDFRGELAMTLVVLGRANGPSTGGAVFIAEEAQPLPGVGAGTCGFFASPGPDSAPALFVGDGASGVSAYSLPASANWIAIDLAGAEKPTTTTRANTGGAGALVEVRAGSRKTQRLADSGSGGSARAPVRVSVGLAGAGKADYARVMWPDAVLQSELELAGGRIHKISELQRKPSSCPILFAWTEHGPEFVADFLGVGGLGYLEGRDVYSKPDPSEYVLLPPLAGVDGKLRLDVLEPLEECTYLDELKLVAVDHPAGVTVLPLEMFAVKGPAPGFELIAFRETLAPVRAVDEVGRDVTAEILAVDRRYANRVERDERFPGLARKPHAIELDFGQRLGDLAPGARRPFLVLHGFVEYGYSTSNFAAWQAGAVFRAPTFSVERGGAWVPLREEWGFPAGYPRYMTVSLEGLLERGDRRLKVETNMDIEWDQAFVVDASSGDDLMVTELAADVAQLAWVGFPPERSPDGVSAPVYVLRDLEESAPYKTFPGAYTRYGDVRDLLAAADDRLAVFGPGDGIRFEVKADRLPPLQEGRRRTFLAKTFGYCKDMDLYTAHPDRVEPLPFRSMSGYPFPAGAEGAAEAARSDYAREWNTRVRR